MAKLKQNPKLRTFDVTAYLDSEEMISAYLSEIFADGTDAEIQAALIDVAKARNMTGSSKTMDVGQPSLYPYLSGDAHTEIETIRNFLDAVGVKMLIVPKSQDSRRAVTVG
jgi:probable addiction module antidote protein